MLNEPKVIEVDISHNVKLRRTIRHTLYGTEEVITIVLPGRGEQTLYTSYPERYFETEKYLKESLNVNLGEWVNHVTSLK